MEFYNTCVYFLRFLHLRFYLLVAFAYLRASSTCKKKRRKIHRPTLFTNKMTDDKQCKKKKKRESKKSKKSEV